MNISSLWMISEQVLNLFFKGWKQTRISTTIADFHSNRSHIIISFWLRGISSDFCFHRIQYWIHNLFRLLYNLFRGSLTCLAELGHQYKHQRKWRLINLWLVKVAHNGQYLQQVVFCMSGYSNSLQINEISDISDGGDM